MKFTICYESVQEFVLENNLTENDTLLLHPQDYDTVAKEYMDEHNLIMSRPIEIFGIRIMEDTSSDARKNYVTLLPMAS
jgi:hypothetical protein